MNRLQSIESRRPLLVTLNRRDAIDRPRVSPSSSTTTPSSTPAAMAAQRRRHEIQGRRGIYFAGAYWGYGFHEDGVQSAREVVRAIGRHDDDRARSTGLEHVTVEPRHATSRPPRSTTGTVRHRRSVPRRGSSPRSCSSPTSTSTRFPGSLDPIPLWSARRPRPCGSAGATSSTAGPHHSATPSATSSRSASDGGRGAGQSPRAPPDVRMAVQSAAVYYCWTADGRHSTRSCSRSRTHRGASGTGTCFDARGGREARTPKAMHVSPFLPMDLDYRITWTAPGAELDAAHRGRARGVRDLRGRSRRSGASRWIGERVAASSVGTR